MKNVSMALAKPVVKGIDKKSYERMSTFYQTRNERTENIRVKLLIE